MPRKSCVTTDEINTILNYIAKSDSTIQLTSPTSAKLFNYARNAYVSANVDTDGWVYIENQPVGILPAYSNIYIEDAAEYIKTIVFAYGIHDADCK